MTPQAIPRLKEVVRNLSISEAERISQHACSLDLARDVEHYLQGELSRLAPDLVDKLGFENDFFAIVGEARLEDLCRNSVVLKITVWRCSSDHKLWPVSDRATAC